MSGQHLKKNKNYQKANAAAFHLKNFSIYWLLLFDGRGGNNGAESSL